MNSAVDVEVDRLFHVISIFIVFKRRYEVLRPLRLYLFISYMPIFILIVAKAEDLVAYEIFMVGTD